MYNHQPKDELCSYCAFAHGEEPDDKKRFVSVEERKPYTEKLRAYFALKK